ncbi:hypothetical protein [Homoserinimonas hongtaonis]|uniref:hypothetical protein n=1 Tax=Homoserinimonas hongtaonis TaxID=2079791 RepID=UPI000D391ED6|nr:hypothetical protein [Salinibacterium hongtaonis]AWB90354.1 hypothetical protein C2138_13040 [Salinibacterium hongtaonis]
MGYGERTIWAQSISSIVCSIVYFAIIIPQLGTSRVDQIDWIAPMLWTILASIILSIALNIVAGIIVGMRDRESAGTSDQRDREIGWFGDRVGQAFLVIGGVGALALTMLGADYFWIGNTLFLGFALSMLLGSVTRIIAYRRGF